MGRSVFVFVLLHVVIALPAVALDCTSVAGNLVPGCGVADPGEAALWSSNGSGATLTYSDIGNPPGSLSADAARGNDDTEWFAGAWTACFAVSASTEYSAGMEMHVHSGGAPVMCGIHLEYYSDGACSTWLSTPTLSPWVTVSDSSWTLVSGTGTSDASAASAHVTTACDSTQDYVVLFDNAITRLGDSVPVTLQGFVAE